MLRHKAHFFFEKTLIFRNSENLLPTLELSLISSKISYKSKKKKKKKIFMVKKDGSFCDQNLQFGVILHKELKIFIFIFFNFNSFFFFFSRYFPLQYSTRPWLSSDTRFLKFFSMFKKL